MKKIGYRLPDCVPALLFKRLLMVKMIVLLICFFSFNSMGNYGFSQEKITLNLENVSYKKAFKAIERQTSYRFVYNDDILPPNQKISISVRSQTLIDVLQKLLQSTSLTYKLMGTDLVIITTGQENDPKRNAKPFVEVSGTVLNSNNQPLANVSVLEKGTANGTTTTDEGRFTINVSNTNAVLVISYVGFTAAEVALNGRTTLSVTLHEDLKEMNQVVVVGYGTQKRSDVTGSVTSVPKSRLSQLPVTNILHAIEGSVAGVGITQNSSVPGSSANVLVRGVNSISAGTGPFVVLDGIPFSGSINDINPNDISSIEILKDASATAIYGIRGANGVILITTKRGSSGKPTIRYSGYGGVENMAHTLEPMNAEQYVQKYADWKTQSGVNNPDPVPTIAEKANYATGTTTDWMKEVTQQGYIHNHNLSVSGGTKDVKYFVSGDYLKQQGFLKGYQYKRISFRSNLDINVTDYLSIGTSLFFSNNNYDGGRINLTQAGQMSPYGQLLNPNGTYYIYPMFTELLYTNPLLGLYIDRLDRSNNMNGNFYAELKPGFLKGLKYRINAAYAYVPSRSSSYTGRNGNNLLGSANVFNSETKSWIVENLLTYNQDWDKHHIDVTALYSAQKEDAFYTSTNATGFINDLLSFNNLGGGATISTGTITVSDVNYSGSYKTERTRLSQMGRINYSYDSRYLLTVTARRDGSSVFGANTSKYGVFPSVAVGWNISNEAFMSGIALIDNLKLRASYGLVGNEAVPINRTATTSSTVRLPYSGVSTIGVVASNLGNADLGWESTYGTNLGIDFSILKNRVSGTIEVYKTKTNDLVLFRNLPTATGYTRVLDNLGKVSNQGIEFTLRTVNIETSAFRWETNINFSSNKNKIIDLYGDKKSDVGNRWFIGQPINVVYDYKLVGVWQEGEDNTKWDPSAKPGDLKFADLNNSGRITSDSDRVILGQTRPKWIGGLTSTFHYKNFHLNIFIQTAQGITKNNQVLTNADQSGIINIPADVTYWTAANKNNSRPAIAYKNPYGYGYTSDADYTRIKDITLSYDASQNILDKTKLSGLTVYISGRNLYTFTDWIGWDPENDFDRGTGRNFDNYPLARSVVFGVNISLR